MRWFINSTKESAGFNDNNFQAQIDAINTRLDSQRMDLTNKTNLFGDSLHNKGIQINNILKHQGNQDDRIDELTKRVKELENLLMPKQLIPDEKPKQTRIVNSYADEKYTNAFKIAMGYWIIGMKQYKIAEKLNAMNIKTPTGKSFHQGNVSDLLANRAQKARFMEGKEKKAKL